LSMLGPSGEAVSAWTPPISVWENEKEFLVCVDLPGVSRRDVEVTVSESLLTVSGQKPASMSTDHQLRANERPLGPFVRRVLLPPSLRRTEASAHVNAQMREGVLEIRVDKEGTQAEKPKTIPVN